MLDGGMGYPMATLISGERNMRSLTGVTVHEGAHSWYYGVLGNNENFYEWMDEGFTSFATAETMNHIFVSGQENPHRRSYQGYLGLARDGADEALITNADHYMTNRAYGTAAYSKGQVLLAQLGYVLGEDVRNAALLSYFDEWKFKHPNPTDFKRIMEKESGIELDWYFEYFMATTKTIDYGVGKIVGTEGKTHITLERIGPMPMPIDLLIEYKDGTTQTFNIPLRIMRGNKTTDKSWELLEDWPWTNPEYVVELNKPVASIKRIEIDPSGLMADIDRSNNVVDFKEEIDFIWMK
jgi:aminopeptidase N